VASLVLGASSCTGSGTATLTLCPTASATLIVTGTNLGPAGSGSPAVTVGGVTCVSTSVTVDDTTLTCTLASTGVGHIVSVTVGGQTSVETGVTLGFAGQCLLRCLQLLRT
jgi:hypothetical protein